MTDWKNYYRKVGDRPNKLISNALQYFPERRMSALDLGAGNLRDSKWLRSIGFRHVTAVDTFKDIRIWESESVEGIEVVVSRMEDFSIKAGSFDLIIACNSLFFIEQHRLRQVLRAMANGLRVGGVMIFNVLGRNDSWIKQNLNVSWLSMEDIHKVLVDLELLEGMEIDLSGTCTHGKVWHTQNIAARRSR